MVHLNANGLRTDSQRTFLGKLLVDLQVGICIVTESHLRKRDLKKLRYKNYVVLADSCRPIPLGEHAAGGVVILVHANFTASELPEIADLPKAMEHCSIKLYLTQDPRTAVRISGLYIPPSGTKKLDMPSLQLLSEPLLDPRTTDALPHIIAGDLNTTSWPSLYQEWLQAAGMCELWILRSPPTHPGRLSISCFSPQAITYPPLSFPQGRVVERA